MSFMKMQITQKGALCTCDCSKCGMTVYAHEWASWDFNEERDAMEAGKLACPDCGGTVDASTFWKSPSRNYYAARYSAPGYLDCTPYTYGKNKRALIREVKEMFGD